MNHLQKSYRPDPHAQYLLQLLALPTALVLIAAIRYVLKVVPAGIVNLICLLLLLAALLGIFILLPFWFRNTRYIITVTRHHLHTPAFFIRREKTYAVTCSAMQHHCANAVLQIYGNDFSAAACLRQHADSAISQKRGCSRTLYAICRFILPCCTGGISCSMNTPSKSCDTRQKTSGC